MQVNYQGKLKFYESQTVIVSCNAGYFFTDKAPSKYISCTRSGGSLLWSGLDGIQCIKASCSVTEEIKKYLIAYNDSYFVDQTVSYTCPNGIIRSASCNWDYDSKTPKWSYKGNCSGDFTFLLSEKSYSGVVFNLVISLAKKLFIQFSENV